MKIINGNNLRKRNQELKGFGRPEIFVGGVGERKYIGTWFLYTDFSELQKDFKNMESNLFRPAVFFMTHIYKLQIVIWHVTIKESSTCAWCHKR